MAVTVLCLSLCEEQISSPRVPPCRFVPFSSSHLGLTLDAWATRSSFPTFHTFTLQAYLFSHLLHSRESSLWSTVTLLQASAPRSLPTQSLFPWLDRQQTRSFYTHISTNASTNALTAKRANKKMKYSMKFVASATALLSTAQGYQTSQFVVYTPGGDDQVVERADAITNPGQLR